MTRVGVTEAKAHLSRLIGRSAAGEEIIITINGRPAARLVPATSERPRELGFDRGHIVIGDDFDAPLLLTDQDEYEHAHRELHER